MAISSVRRRERTIARFSARGEGGGVLAENPSALPRTAGSEPCSGPVTRPEKIICHPDVTGTGRGQVTLRVPGRLSRHVLTPALRFRGRSERRGADQAGQRFRSPACSSPWPGYPRRPVPAIAATMTTEHDHRSGNGADKLSYRKRSPEFTGRIGPWVPGRFVSLGLSRSASLALH